MPAGKEVCDWYTVKGSMIVKGGLSGGTEGLGEVGPVVPELSEECSGGTACISMPLDASCLLLSPWTGGSQLCGLCEEHSCVSHHTE